MVHHQAGDDHARKAIADRSAIAVIITLIIEFARLLHKPGFISLREIMRFKDSRRYFQMRCEKQIFFLSIRLPLILEARIFRINNSAITVISFSFYTYSHFFIRWAMVIFTREVMVKII